MKNILLATFIICTTALYAQSPFHTIPCGDPIHTYSGEITDSTGTHPEITFNSDDVPKVGAYGEVFLHSTRGNMSINFAIGKIKVVEVVENIVKVQVLIKKGEIIMNGKAINQFDKIGSEIKFEEYEYGFESTGTEKWDNGKLKMQGQLRCLKKIGEWKTFYEDETLESESNYNDEHQLDGAFIEYYHNGNTKTSGRYRDGAKGGTWVELFEDGKVKTQGYYNDGKKVGKWIEQNAKGKKVKVKY